MSKDKPIKTFKDLFPEISDKKSEEDQINHIKNVVFGIKPKDNSLKSWIRKNQKPD